jgi:hypothetical protein
VQANDTQSNEMPRYAKAVILTTGLTGAVLGALTALGGGMGLIAVMAALGAAFGVPIGGGIALLLGMVSKVRAKSRRVPPLDRDTLRDWHEEQIAATGDEKAFRDNFYPGNPDPESRVMMGWGLPRGHADSVEARAMGVTSSSEDC